MNRIDQTFQDLRARGQKAFLPFITAGDPDLVTTEQLIRELSRRGANIIEIGIPYSDPIADGPIIQASYTRSLRQELKLDAIFQSLAELTSAPSDKPLSPLVVMVSYAIVFRYGCQRFVEAAKGAGLCGMIVPDLPVEEAAELSTIARRNGLALILLVTPTTPRERAIEIARVSSGFLYYVSVAGITGERVTLPPGIAEQVAWLKTITSLPVCIGFGISRPEHIQMLAPVADGVIVGSAIVRRIGEGAGKPREQLVNEIGEFVAGLTKAAGL